MNTQLQKADLWKRISAWLFDLILLACVVVLFAMALSALLDYDGHYQKLEKIYEQYETEFGIDREMTQERYDAMTQDEKTAYDEACQKADEAISEDEVALKAYNMVINLTLIIASVSILLAMTVMEFAIPLWLKNGQTIGKKAFGLAVVRTDSIRMPTIQLFIRTVLGKFAVETMVPVYVLILVTLGAAGPVELFLLAAIMLAQLLCPMFTRQNRGLHDLMASTVVVDMATTRIFTSSDELIEYTKQVHAEQAARQDY